jgi:ABC-2 type transport system ATP-binding protein
MTDSDILVEQLRRRFGGTGRDGFEAVRGVSFIVRRGELFALLGTNGAGKTSTLEVLEGLAPATSGRVRVLGHDPYRDRRRVRHRVGIMLQEGGFPAHLTVRETASSWARTLTRPAPVVATLEQVDLAHRAGVPVAQLSGGERRRLDLALAVLGRPEVLFLDEPTAGLDHESRARAWQLIRDLLGEGTTVVLTTHYLEEAETLADRIAILDAGAIVREGTPAQVTAAQPARISFALPTGVGAPPAGLPGALESSTTADGVVVVRTDDLQRTLTALLTWAGAHDVRLTDLHARPASLEEAFLALADAAGGPRGQTRATPQNEEARA